MIGKPLHLIVWEDIEALAREGIAESTYLEFKSQPIQETLEIARDISSMSNGGGGYLVLGVPELNGVAQAPIPFPNGEAEGRRIVQVVAAGVSPPLRAIESRFLASPAGGDVVVVRVPRSRIPAMVHFQGRTEFWVRRDRQRVPMAHAEIVDRIRLGVEEMRNREEFRDKRLARCGAEHRGGIQMVLIATPHIPPGESAVPVESPDVQAVIRDRSDDQRAYVWGVRPQPSLSGIVGIIDGYTFEIHRDGYVEVRHRNIDILEERMPVPQTTSPQRVPNRCYYM